MSAASRYAQTLDVAARQQLGIRLRDAREAARLIGRQQSPALRREIGAVLKAARDAAGLSQTFVARHLGISAAMVCFFETGQRRVPLERLGEVASIYGLTPEQLEQPPVVTRDTDEAQIVLAFRHLADADRRALLELLRP
ncbi:helix-turn-helix transcriptional regulator [Methylobacterium mesophilicum SR1.6/6]|uniref:Helix-turn-helix transcriptional regulator n=1 Tax=Methylobacterium mesophilicum SR1.6/6 TaxID=908290 RepID=A0A6B9FMF3_9HYPH|nr:helix-turn-helix transcriptional regulator [Methylobacterium mesophilicum]QGY02354.1 helix-turn-helix transcriptional regulator [Methylobacterium mesophilicum SR1.6/6]